MTRLWVLNLDAEHELARPKGYTPSAASERHVALHAPRATGLLRPGDQWLAPDGPTRLPGARGVAWCPTPSALRRLRRAGATPLPSPPLSVLRAVNDRAFCAGLGQTLPGADFARSLADVDARVSTGGPWLLKRAFGVAGRGQRPVGPAPLSDAERAWVQASFRIGGLQVEPRVRILAEMVLHGEVHEDGSIRIGLPCRQICDARGAWQDTRPLDPGDLEGDARSAIVREGEHVGAALREAGYFGPFGVDSYVYRHGNNVHVNPRSEINARYTMGWHIGLGHAPDG